MVGVAEAKQIARVRFFDAEAADPITIDGAEMLGHIDRSNVVADEHYGSFRGTLTIVLDPDALDPVPVPEQDLNVNGETVRVVDANRDALALTIEGILFHV